ncbi:hypothetical protein BDA99DRAFT_569640 [Phascolomyces articulosus]|uniref:Uncharacterized protein n=1 Tax=Phascolomyces articulosus TaxID=60185 RepID=A0AAD5K6U9_9FUNG|nr:hypothetical protein BDA99DRAFT_569640 [Phascolomyces articulosus]
MTGSNPQPPTLVNPQPHSPGNPQPTHQPVEYKVVIAYDFGTTYSGAAYAFTHSTPTEVFDIQKWPQKGGNYYPKVPTLSVYPRLNEKHQSETPKRPVLSGWGHGAKKTMLKPGATKHNVLLSRFKLHLDESLKRPPLENGITPVHAVTDYLAALHQHTLQELSRSFAKNYHPDTFRYCLTVPAVWSDKAKNSMRQVAIQAGLVSPSDPPDRLVLVSEPEAAAIYCEETMSEEIHLKDNDRIMICDAGGGTVDLIVFQVNFTNDLKDGNLWGGNRRELKEVTKGIGESCGSVFLDDRFYTLLQQKLGDEAMNKMNQRELNGVLNQFIDNVKPDFDGVSDHFIELPRSIKLNDLPETVLEDDINGYLDEGMLKLSAQELTEQVFNPVIDQVLSLIDRQYQQIPDGRLDYLFLVGGFGSSKYLYQKVQNAFQPRKINQVLNPEERAALAVVRGAAYFGVHSQTIVSRVSRRTYGINILKPFEKNIDPLSKRLVQPDGTIRCKDRFSTFVKKSDELSVDHCIEEKYFVYYTPDKIVTIVLYATENDNAPRYCDESGVHRIANISIPFPDMPYMKRNERLWFTVRMFFGRTEIRMEAEFSTGQKYDVNCDFHADLK